MPTFQRMASYLSIIAWTGMLLPPSSPSRVVAGQPALAFQDTSLDAAGTLTGRLTDRNQLPMAGIPVALSQAGSYLTTTTTDAEGYFRFVGLRGGLYSVSAGNDWQMVRVWMPGTAPPHATGAVNLTASHDAVRGQGPVGIGVVPLACLGMSVTALALSIILPITLSNDDDPEAS